MLKTTIFLTGKIVIECIRRQIPHEEFDYLALLDCLKCYAHPRDKITDLLRKGWIIRVKKGLYVFGDSYARGAYAREVLANLIYGPSYISMDYALYYYGLIPERVETITSVTCGYNRTFSTPVGKFTYRGVPLLAYQTGVQRIELGSKRAFLIATPEKALADKVRNQRGYAIRSQRDMKIYLFDDLRVDEDRFYRLDADKLHDIVERYRSQKLRLLQALLYRHQRSEDVVYA